MLEKPGSGQANGVPDHQTQPAFVTPFIDKRLECVVPAPARQGAIKGTEVDGIERARRLYTAQAQTKMALTHDTR